MPRFTVRKLRRRVATLERENAALREQLTRDPKTGALHATAFTEALERTVRQRRETPSSSGTLLIYLDIIDFGTFNDRFGQRGGDAVLCHLVDTLRTRVREGDVVGRVGGDEFAVFFDHITEDEAHSIAHRLNKTFAAYTLNLVPRNEVKEIACSVEVHVGAVWWPRSHPPTATEAIRIGDDLMWASKDASDGTVAWRTLAPTP